MATEYPDDADGDALRRVAATGSNMSKPMDIDFQIIALDEATANRVADGTRKLGYRAQVYAAQCDSWNCQCTKAMIPTYPSLRAAQIELDAIARPLGASADGWGTYGGGKNYTRSGLQPEPAKRRWFQYSLRSLLVAVPTLGISLGMFYVAFSTGFTPVIQLLAALLGLLLFGGVIGAAVGYAEDPEHGSMVRQRAIFGAILFAGMPVFLYVAFWVYYFMSFRGASL